MKNALTKAPFRARLNKERNQRRSRTSTGKITELEGTPRRPMSHSVESVEGACSVIHR